MKEENRVTEVVTVGNAQNPSMSPVEGVEAGWRVLVCGGRDYADAGRVAQYLDWLHGTSKRIVLVIEGGAKGADALARDWAKSRGVAVETHLAQWATEGPSAGPKRNQKMLDVGKPSFVVAFPGGKGTEDMARRAIAAGLRVFRP